MANPLAQFRLHAVEILRQPGAIRQVDAVVAAGVLGVDDERATGEITLSAEAISSIDGVVVRGVVAVPWAANCRRCLIDVDGVAKIAIDELFQYDPTIDDANPIDGELIDLAPIVRDLALLELPDGPLCRPECAGICPVCGADRNQTPCTCDTTVRDDRWAALDDLKP